MSSAAPYRPRKVPAAEAAFTNAVRGRRRRLAFEFGGATWVARLSPAGPPRSGSVLKLADGAGNAWVRLADWSFLPAVSELAGGAFEALPAEVQCIVAEAALAPALDALGDATGSAWRVEEFGAWPSEYAHAVGFELRDAAGAIRRGDLAVDAAASERFVELVRRAAPAPSRELGDVPLPVRLLIGETRLKKSDLAGLRAGDVVLIEHLSAPANDDEPPGTGGLALVGARLAFGATIRHRTATLRGAATVPPDAEDEVVRFEIPGVPTTMAAAKDLQVKAALPLAAGIADVRLTVAGRTVATGSLVICAGQAGVRLRVDVHPSVADGLTGATPD